MIKRILFCILAMWCFYFQIQAQQFNGTTGLIHVPTAEMNASGTVCIGVHFIPKTMTPDEGFSSFGKKYHTFSNSLSATPFPWIEIGYTYTLLRNKLKKEHKGSLGGYNAKDRYFSVKIRPLKEGKYWPAIAVGGYDFFDTSTKASDLSYKGGQLYWGNFYGVASKHFLIKRNELAVHVAYRYYRRGYNAQYEGVIGGISYRPAFDQRLRIMAEYNGNSFNVGADYFLFNHWLIQVALWECQSLTCGIRYQLNLF